MRTVEDQRASLAASPTSTSHVLQSLLSAQAAGTLKGIVGRLGDLGIIPAQYDVAITTACPALNDIVVDSEAAATAAIAHLKRHALGRARFILLDKVARGEGKGKGEATPEGSERLVELVEVKEERVRVAFQFALKDTLVCPSMAEAMRVGFEKGKRRRVVTYDGKLIEPTGTMSGGGSQVQRGGMRSAWGKTVERRGVETAEKEVKAMDEELKAIERQLAELLPTKKAAAQQQKEVTALLEAVKAAVGRIERQVEGAEAEYDAVKGRLDALRSTTALTAEEEKRLAQLLPLQAAHERGVADAKEACKGLEDDLAAIEARIMEAGGQKLKDGQSALTTLSAELDGLTAAIARFDVTQAGHVKAIKRLQRDIGDNERGQDELRTQLAALVQGKKALEDDALQVLQLFNEAQQLVADKEAAMKAVRKQLEAVQAEVDAAKERMLDLQLALEEKDAVRRDAGGKAEAARRKLREAHPGHGQGEGGVGRPPSIWQRGEGGGGGPHSRGQLRLHSASPRPGQGPTGQAAAGG